MEPQETKDYNTGFGAARERVEHKPKAITMSLKGLANAALEQAQSLSGSIKSDPGEKGAYLKEQTQLQIQASDAALHATQFEGVTQEAVLGGHAVLLAPALAEGAVALISAGLSKLPLVGGSVAKTALNSAKVEAGAANAAADGLAEIKAGVSELKANPEKVVEQFEKKTVEVKLEGPAEPTPKKQEPKRLALGRNRTDEGTPLLKPFAERVGAKRVLDLHTPQGMDLPTEIRFRIEGADEIQFNLAQMGDLNAVLTEGRAFTPGSSSRYTSWEFSQVVDEPELNAKTFFHLEDGSVLPGKDFKP